MYVREHCEWDWMHVRDDSVGVKDKGGSNRIAAKLQDQNESLLAVKISLLFWKVAKGHYGVKSVPSLTI